MQGEEEETGGGKWWTEKAGKLLADEGKPDLSLLVTQNILVRGTMGLLMPETLSRVMPSAVFYSPAQGGSPEVSAPPSFSEQPQKGIRDALKHPG